MAETVTALRARLDALYAARDKLAAGGMVTSVETSTGVGRTSVRRNPASMPDLLRLIRELEQRLARATGDVRTARRPLYLGGGGGGWPWGC